MATKKQKRAAGELKQRENREANKQAGLKAQQRDQQRRRQRQLDREHQDKRTKAKEAVAKMTAVPKQIKE